MLLFNSTLQAGFVLFSPIFVSMENVGEPTGKFVKLKSIGTTALVGDKSFPFQY